MRRRLQRLRSRVLKSALGQPARAVYHRLRNSPLGLMCRAVYGAIWAAGHRIGLGHVPPPHAFKEHVVRSYGRRYGLTRLVETGTYKGDVLRAVGRSFTSIYSIELDDALFQQARQRFAHHTHIQLLHGDSGELLPLVLDSLDGPALFWLDAHYSGPGTAGEKLNPIEREIDAILNCEERGHILLIDDARGFLGSDGYPTLDRLRATLKTVRPDLRLTVGADIMRIEPTTHR